MPDNWIPTATGGRVFLAPVDVSQVRIRDISLGLARVCRFNGQIDQLAPFYSVAEHCVWASYIAPAGHRLAALVHDAAEALIGDVTSPLKRLLPDYKAIEIAVEDALWAKFRWPDSRTAAVKRVDQIMLATERDAMVKHGNRPWNDCEGVERAKITFHHWLPTMAWVAWEDRYNELTTRGDY